MAVEIQPFNLAGTLSNAETIRGQRAQNRLLALTEPYKMRELQRGEQDAMSAQRDAEMKRTGAAARLALGVIGDVGSLNDDERQQRYSSARQMVADMGVDVSKIPPTYSDDVYRGIQALAQNYGSDATDTVQSVKTDSQGNRVLVFRSGKEVVTGKDFIGLTYDKETNTYFDPVTRQTFRAVGGQQPQQPSAVTQDQGGQPAQTPTQQAQTDAFEQAQRDKARREAEAAAQKESAAAAAKGNVESLSSAIDAANVSVTGIAPVVRALDLLDKVQTGGIQSSWGLRLKQAVGSESGDEGELSNLLGRSVLAQLRPIFGAAFTAAEGERLSSIEASFGRSPETNRRLLRNALDVMVESTERGIRAARQRGDTFTANELEMKLRQARAAIQGASGQQGGNRRGDVPQGGKPPVITTKAQYDALPSGSVYVEQDGKRYRKP